MIVILELLLFIGIFFPLYHVINALLHQKKPTPKAKSAQPPISILIPCYNEAVVAKTVIRGITNLKYPNYECFFINDGSTDDTLKVFRDLLQLKPATRRRRLKLGSAKAKKIYRSTKYPQIYLIDKENGGKGEALNEGINYSSHKIIVTLDADSVMKSDALDVIAHAFSDKNTVAASGSIHIMQSIDPFKRRKGPTLKLSNLLKLQTLEYIKSCYCYKASLAKLDSLLVISGAFGVFRKDILVKVNGFDHVIGEDLDLTLKIQRIIENTEQKIAYLPEAVCFTEAPETYRDFIKQRRRWQQCFVEALYNNRKWFFREAFTSSLPFFFFLDIFFMNIMGSLMFLLIFPLFLVRDILDEHYFSILIAFLLFLGVQVIYSLAGLIIAGRYGVKFRKIDFLRIIYVLLLDLTFFRFVVLLSILSGTIAFFTNGKKKDWNKITRSNRDYLSITDGGDE